MSRHHYRRKPALDEATNTFGIFLLVLVFIVLGWLGLGAGWEMISR